MKKLYLIGSLRNPEVPLLANRIQDLGFDVFSDWFAAGERADDSWQTHETARGRSYAEALCGYAARHVFQFDLHHLNESDAAVLLLPAGRSGHLELGYIRGQGKPGYVLFEGGVETKLPPDWHWLLGLYEGEGSITRNGKRGGHGLKLSITMADEDIIRRIADISTVGRINGPYRGKHQGGKTGGVQGPWAPMWRWTVYKKEDILYVLRGLWPGLGRRRQRQVRDKLALAGIDDVAVQQGPTPYESRWDIMYQLATDVFFEQEALLGALTALLASTNVRDWQASEAQEGEG